MELNESWNRFIINDNLKSSRKRNETFLEDLESLHLERCQFREIREKFRSEIRECKKEMMGWNIFYRETNCKELKGNDR